LVDIRLMTFRLQTAKRLLYNNDSTWFDTAVALLRRAGGMGLDEHLFLIKLEESLKISHLSTNLFWKAGKF